MSGNKIFLDTNIVLYLLKGNDTLVSNLDKKELYISIITEMELRSFSNISNQDENLITDFLREYEIIPLSHNIKEEAIRIGKTFNLKLPDSIIAATASVSNIPLITADYGFKKLRGIPIIIYENNWFWELLINSLKK